MRGNGFNSAMEFLASLFGRFTNALDSLEVVQGVSILSIMLAVIIVLAVIGSIFKGGNEV